MQALGTWYQFPGGELGKTPGLTELKQNKTFAFPSDGGATATSYCECVFTGRLIGPGEGRLTHSESLILLNY